MDNFAEFDVIDKFTVQCECGHTQRAHRHQIMGEDEVTCEACGRTGYIS